MTQLSREESKNLSGGESGVSGMVDALDFNPMFLNIDWSRALLNSPKFGVEGDQCESDVSICSLSCGLAVGMSFALGPLSSERKKAAEPEELSEQTDMRRIADFVGLGEVGGEGRPNRRILAPRYTAV